MAVLSAPERRAVLFALRDADPDDDILARVDDGTAGSDHRTKMRHGHLPKLADCGLIDWDRTADTVRRGPAFEEIEPLLDVLVTSQDTLRLEVDSP
jgi:hypothetical protein